VEVVVDVEAVDDVDVAVVEVVVVVVVVVELEVVVVDVAACISIAASSQESPLLAVHLHVTWPGVEATAELDAPVIAPGKLTSHSCAQLGEARVTPPHIDGRSRTQLFE
jgi:hypothetical protein